MARAEGGLSIGSGLVAAGVPGQRALKLVAAAPLGTWRAPTRRPVLLHVLLGGLPISTPCMASAWLQMAVLMAVLMATGGGVVVLVCGQQDLA